MKRLSSSTMYNIHVITRRAHMIREAWDQYRGYYIMTHRRARDLFARVRGADAAARMVEHGWLGTCLEEAKMQPNIKRLDDIPIYAMP